MNPRLCIELHDVAPATWTRCASLLAMTDALGAPPVTLLVVPEYHRRGHLHDCPDTIRAIDRRVRQGDEVALHGFYHVDESPSPSTPGDWLRRRVLTSREGEFATLSRAEALSRINAGYDALRTFDWPVRGFVAPAWLNNASTWLALRETPLRYAASRSELVPLRGSTRIRAPAITVSARSPWRRVASRVWLRGKHRLTASAPLLRVALHPIDAQHARVMDDWRDLLRSLLDQRECLTTNTAAGFA